MEEIARVKFPEIICCFLVMTLSSSALCYASNNQCLAVKQQTDEKSIQRIVEKGKIKISNNQRRIQQLQKRIIEELQKNDVVLVYIDGNPATGKSYFSQELSKYNYGIPSNQIMVVHLDEYRNQDPQYLRQEDYSYQFRKTRDNNPQIRLFILEGYGSVFTVRKNANIKILLKANLITRVINTFSRFKSIRQFWNDLDKISLEGYVVDEEYADFVISTNLFSRSDINVFSRSNNDILFYKAA